MTGSAREDPRHFPALCAEVVEWLAPRPGQVVVDATVGLGGHASALLAALRPGGRLIGLDADPEALRLSAARLAGFAEMVVLRRARFSRMTSVLRDLGHLPVDAILADLGLSEFQIRSPRFSFRASGPLDFRIDPDLEETVADLLREATVREMTEWLRRYGDEPYAAAIARAIDRARARGPVLTIEELVGIIQRAVPPARRPRGKHVATRAFQALRIVLNREMEELDSLLDQAPALLRPGGRLAILSYHSLEHGRVRRALRREAQGCICPPDLPVCACGRRPRLRLLTRRPVRPSDEQVAAHPTVRTAQLRVVERLGPPASGGSPI